VEVKVPEEPFTGTLILGRPTDRSITASLLWDRDAQVFLEYGTEPHTYRQRSAALSLEAGLPRNLTLESLSPDTRYYYRVRTGSGQGMPDPAPQEHTFHTQRAPGQPFTFDVDADPHWGETNFDSTVYAATMGLVAADAPDFFLDLGDSFMTEKLGPTSYEEADARVAGLRPFWAIPGPSVPLLLVIGNHEGEQGWGLDGTAENLSVWATRARQKYYPNPVPGGFYTGSGTSEPHIGVRDGYYAFTWGDALFVVLDVYWYGAENPGKDLWSFTLGTEQYRWLEATLSGSRAPFKFVFAHQLLGGIGTLRRGGVEAAPFYEWGGRNPDGSWGFSARRPGWDMPIHQLFVETGVTAFFHGHDHFYGKQELDGVVYQEVPQPSFARTNDSSSATEYGYRSGVILASAGYLRIRVEAGQAMVEYVKVYPPGAGSGLQTGTVAHSYTLSPRR
jgi:hypothetical protein